MNLDWLTSPQALIGLVTLTLLEIVLGIDNIVFISIVAGQLPPDQQPKARKHGLLLALIPRVVLLMFIGWLLRLTAPIVTFWGTPGDANPVSLSGKDILLVGGGLFLIAKSVREIHSKLEGGNEEEVKVAAKVSYSGVLLQIMLINVVFSLDSLVTAIGMVSEVAVMVVAVVLSTLVMVAVAAPVGAFVEKHPTVKMLALSFLVLIGANLLGEGFGQHIPKGYTYFAMAFAVVVELINLRMRTVSRPVQLHGPADSVRLSREPQAPSA